MRRDGASTQMKSAPGGLQAKDPKRTGMVPGRTLSAPGWCRVQKTSQCAGRAPRPTLSAPGWCRSRNPKSAPGGRLGGPECTGRVPGRNKDPEKAPGWRWGELWVHRDGAEGRRRRDDDDSLRFSEE